MVALQEAIVYWALFYFGPFALQHFLTKLEMRESKIFCFHQISHFLRSLWPEVSNPSSFIKYETWYIKDTG